MPFQPTITEARIVQGHFGYQEFHVAYIIPGEFFVLAHTDDERATMVDLHNCEFHKWLAAGATDCCFKEPGWYLITDIHDAVGLAF